MKKIFAIVGAIALVIIPVFVTYFLNRNVPDIRYTLSERISVSFPSPDEKLSGEVQQLEVRNIGNAEAKKIVVKINGVITTYRIEKVSEGDDVKVFNQGSNFELTYPDLPAQAGFKLVFISSGKGIEYNDVSIIHSSGKGTEALATKDTSVLSYVLWGEIILYFGLNIWVGRRAILENIKRLRIELDARLKKVEDLWERKAPFYVSDKEWRSLFRETIEKQIKEDYSTHDLKNSLAYAILSSDKHKNLDDVSWNSFVDKSIEFMSKNMIAEANSSIYSNRIAELLRLPKPKHFPQDIWDDLIEKIGEKYISNRKSVYGVYSSPENILRELREKRPQGIPDNQWSDYIEHLHKRYISSLLDNVMMFYGLDKYLKGLQNERPDEIPEELWREYKEKLISGYFNALSNELELSINPIKFLEGKDLSFFSAKAQASLRERAYRMNLENTVNASLWTAEQANKFLEAGKPEWMHEFDYTSLKSKAEGIIETEKQRRRYSELKNLIKAIINQESIKDIKPEELTDEDWQSIKKFELQVKELYTKAEEAEKVYKESRDEAARLLEDHRLVRDMKEKIEWQLNVINEFLNDTSVLDRIEEYSNHFAEGNLKNLKKIAILLAEAQNLESIKNG
jgi:hypothetical protein